MLLDMKLLLPFLISQKICKMAS